MASSRIGKRELKRGYVAGLFDGEGCVAIRRHPRPNGWSPNHQMEISITSTNREIIDDLHAQFAGYISKSHERQGARTCWNWRLSGKAAASLLRWILPELRIKWEQARLAIEFQAHREGQHFQRLSDEEVAWRDSYRDAIMELNRAA